MSAGLVVPGLFFRPLRFVFTSSWLILISNWYGNSISTREKGDIASAAQYIIALIDLSSLRLFAMSGRTLIVASTVSLVVSRTTAFVINHRRQKLKHGIITGTKAKTHLYILALKSRALAPSRKGLA